MSYDIIDGPGTPVQPLNQMSHPSVSPVEFKLLFTSAERIAIAQARTGDLILDDFYSILDDSRLTKVDLNLDYTQQGLSYLVYKGLITEERKNQILTGTFQ